MALVDKLDELKLEKNSKHQSVDCTFTVVKEGGETFLQIDTYGSSHRQIKNKKSQSLRFSPKAIAQLKEILSEL